MWSVDECDCVPTPAVACGPSVCEPGQVCCNPSCGVGTAPGGACDLARCTDPPPRPVDAGLDCSGIAALCVTGTVWSVEACGCVPGEPCGTATCTGGQLCCNESCGICTEPDGACTQQLCEPEAECTSDSECNLVDDYCGGCNCLALPPGGTAPTCSDPVQCFAEPCLNRVARCVDGTCTAATSSKL
jgi:hypothetical protein